MKGAATILQVVLLFAIATSLAAAAAPWAYNTLQKTMDTSEMGVIRDQMVLCNDKLIETARTGTSNRCVFSANRGKVSALTDGIYYNLLSKAPICDEHDWVEVDLERHLESMCDDLGTARTYTMRWRWPSNVKIEGKDFTGEVLKRDDVKYNIEFDTSVTFRTVTVIVEFDYTPGEAGKIVEISRKALTKDSAVLSVKIN
ncbi:MAG: hypothetical protein KJ697_00350 [Nanoarchaeota archaeon]|nr:hypothetical protein [Nanoarchaeota archaeon]MBU4072463.1 hypothetical protein [Candidatus Thermoplasmatota archaeon]MBU4124238.1 hypothetical protein [Nanoarchaeota archaeon]